MCELFAVTAKRKTAVGDTLKTFFSHSEEHRHGWGLYTRDGADELMVKEGVKASDSPRLKSILSEDIETRLCIAHIRYATIGEVCVSNSHPFTALSLMRLFLRNTIMRRREARTARDCFFISLTA